MNDQRTSLELFNLNGRVALITGASGYLGYVMATSLAEAGATVIAASRSAERACTAANSLPVPQGQRHLGIALDHLEGEIAMEAFDAAAVQAGGIDILINNGHDPLAADLTTVTADQFKEQLAHAAGYFLLARKLRDHAVDRGTSASVVMLGSMYSVVGSYPDAYSGISPASPVAYHALKGGIVQMTRHLAVYWARDRVRVNCLSPGPFPAANAPEALCRRLSERSPMGRVGSPRELSGALLLLASDAGSYITGQNILVDGGWTAW